uniref:Uncharacterized protein n=1 Tax=Knipowitschia caucasica TaxID=637954 RepID=A0AAV2KA17_KNICA
MISTGSGTGPPGGPRAQYGAWILAWDTQRDAWYYKSNTPVLPEVPEPSMGPHSWEGFIQKPPWSWDRSRTSETRHQASESGRRPLRPPGGLRPEAGLT